ncbi:hypothetical protein Vadar_019916 [Vaccinium darrowii]|uniref:Uncharacterized protein n=1 Tax=Vaccinium darrowii TaxID=229202 RepID=A0ACB7X2C6_9ERIC|nr:hypothetical protein Vadar_019916 [Vaccinium darrowii]
MAFSRRNSPTMSVAELKESHLAATETVNALRERLKQKLAGYARSRGKTPVCFGPTDLVSCRVILGRTLNRNNKINAIRHPCMMVSLWALLTGKSNVGSRSCLNENEIKPGTDDQGGHWVFGEKEDVFYRDEKVGVKQVGEYWEAGHKIEYRIIEYQLDPAPDYTEVFIILDPAPAYTETCRWYVCKLYMDAHGGPQDSVESELKTETVGKMEETVDGVPCGNAVRKILE